MELNWLLIDNQTKLELTGLFIEPVDESGNVVPDSADTLGTFNVRARVQSGQGSSQLVPLHGDAHFEYSRIRVEFGPDQRLSFLTASGPRPDGVVEIEQHGPLQLRLFCSVEATRTVFTIRDAAATDSAATPAAPTGSTATPAAPKTYVNWMSRLADDAVFSALTIPGTHQTCSRYGGASTICQTMTLREQLDAGIRFIDIRCKLLNDQFWIYHGIIYQHLGFDVVRDDCLNFLKANPSETIIMSLKDEGTADPNNFIRTFEGYIKDNRGSWYLDPAEPTLSKVRGKIVLFRRFGPASPVEGLGLKALPWPYNTTFSIFNPRMEVQDASVVDTIYRIPEKWDKVKDLLDAARGGHLDIWYANFCSGSCTAPEGVAKGASGIEGVNSHLKSYLTSTTGRVGTVLMDFPEWPDNVLIGRLIQRNWS